MDDPTGVIDRIWGDTGTRRRRPRTERKPTR
jgi:hypothetical protein